MFYIYSVVEIYSIYCLRKAIIPFKFKILEALLGDKF